MPASQPIYRPLFVHVPFTLILVLACIMPGNDAVFGQRRIEPQEQSQQSHPMHLRFPGEQPRPLAMVSGDFDEDGVNDLVIGYGLQKGGSITFLRGNPDAHAPQTNASWLAAGRHQYSDPYLQRSKAVSVASQPSLMVSADVNGDGHLDLVFASQGSSQLSVMFGDGKGNFLAPISASVAGGITALASYRPGAPLMGEAVIAAYQSPQGARLSVLSYNAKALAVRATYALPGVATAMSVANLDADSIPDTAVVAGGKLLILHGKTALSGRTSMTTVPISGAEAVTVGEFLFDRHAQLQLSVLTTNGDVIILAHRGFDPRPYTPQEIAETRRGMRGHAAHTQTLSQLAGNTGNAPWVEVERSFGAGVHASGGKAPILLRSRTSGSGGDDLVVLNSSQQQRTVISHSLARTKEGFSVAGALPPSRVTSSGLTSSNVVAAVSVQVSPDAGQGLVVLIADDPSLEIIDATTSNTYFVGTTADNTTDAPDSGSSSCSISTNTTCTLRDAILLVNADASANISGGTSDIIMVPSGTYGLTWQAGTFDANANAVTHLEILGPVTIIGNASGGTIIDGMNNDTVFTINPGSVGSINPSGASYVFDAELENLTIENGKNQNNPNNSTTGLFNNVGGCINWDAFGTGNLTLTNSTVENCTILWGPGGGIWAFNSAGGGTGTLTLNGDMIENNSTPEEGGAVYIAFAPAAVSATNTIFSTNKADATLNSSDGDADGAGGGLYFSERQSPPSTPQSTLTSVTIISNTAAQDNGGGIYTNTGLLIGSSVFQSNSAAAWGGGLHSEVALETPPSPYEVQTTITNSNFLSNSATTTGGAISGGTETQANGNILQVSLSRIFGNTSTHGASGLSVGVPGLSGAGEVLATDNWWGCNGGPATTGDGCDQAVIYDASTGSLSVTPYAVFSFTSDIRTIPQGGTMNLALNLNTDSNNTSIGPFSAVAGYPYTFDVTGVTASPELTGGTLDSSGAATATLTPTTTGNGKVTATFDGQIDTINFVAQAPTATSLAITATPGLTFLYGQPASFTVQLTPSDATGITTGNFTATIDGTPLGLTLISNNNYQITGPFNLLSPGGHTLAVNFLGTTNFTATSTSATLNVSAGTVTITDTVTPANPVKGQGGTVAVTVTGVGSGAAPTGLITYAFDGGTPASTSLSGGVANISIPTLIQTGSHSLSLTYNGDGNYAIASTTVSLTIFGGSQTTIASLTSTSATINVFGLGFTAPSGQLSFMDTTSGNPVAAPVMLNTATAATSLLPQVTTSTGDDTLPDWTTLADVNGDGKLDLITSVYLTDSVTVQLGNGDGTFQAATAILITAGFGPAENHLVSLRGNGTLDLVVASFNTNQIAVLLGNGNGTFQSPAFYTVGTAANTPTSLTTGDFNHDGNLDVAVANTGDNTVSILFGNGGGGLTPSGAPINVGQGPEAIRAGDFNDDGYSDLAVANYHDGTVTTLVNNQNGTFTATTISIGSGAGSGPQALAINGTGGNLLLAVANFKDNTVSVLKSNGSGAFGAQTIVSVGKGPDDVSFADLNGDGIPDLVVSNYTDDTVSLVSGSAGGSYSSLGPFSVGDSPYSAAVGDLDMDGTPDLVVSNCFSNNTGVLLSGTQISVPYSGLSLPSGDALNATYTPDGSSQYGSSISPNVTVP